jgi:hypothetical protein
MSRPYIHIASATYSSGVLTLGLQAYHTRGGGSATITGFSLPLTYNILGTSLDGTETATFSKSQLGATPSGTYNLVVNFPDLGYNTGIYPGNSNQFTF